MVLQLINTNIYGIDIPTQENLIAATRTTEKIATYLGVDGLIVSNHGGRQLDAGQSSIMSMINLVKKYHKEITIMVDSGLRGGPDIARAMASGAAFTFMGRSFMYGVGALGKQGGDHSISLIKKELQQVMEQLCCQTTNDFQYHLV